MDKMKFETPNLTAQNIDKIAALFPNCVTEMRGEDGKIKCGGNFEMLRQMLSPDVVDGDECYDRIHKAQQSGATMAEITQIDEEYTAKRFQFLVQSRHFSWLTATKTPCSPTLTNL